MNETYSHKSRFNFGDRVVIDKDKSLIATVTAFQFRSEHSTVELSWIHNGESKSAWVESWRLSRAD